MPSYWQLLLLILPIFAFIVIGAVMRRVRWLTAEADASLLKLVVGFLYPCLILDNVLGNVAARQPGNLLAAPLVGFGTIAAGIGLAYYVGRALGLARGQGLRTFAFTTGIENYGYIPIPLMAALFGRESLGVLLVHNIGCEAAIWTVGILVLAGLPLREGWRKLLNPPVFALITAVTINLTGLGRFIPEIVRTVIHLAGECAIPMGLLLIGATMMEYLSRPRELVDGRVTPVSAMVRLCMLPLLFLLLAKSMPFSVELKRVIVVQAAMPAGIFPVVIAKHYGGRTLTGMQVVAGTTALGLLLIPFWLRFGMHWVLAR